MTSMLRALAVSIAVLTASCSDFHAKEAQGGETHFLRECPDDACPEGLSCICGVCTATCENDDACALLGGEASCAGTKLTSLVCGDEVPPVQTCDATCSSDAQCDSLGDDYECVQGRCRPEAIAIEVVPNDDGEIEPLIFIVLDTSTSMERLAECSCTTAGCAECLPECSAEGSEKNRWAFALEALTGTFDDFSCEAIDRDTMVDTYDSMERLPYHAPKGKQRADGILQTYASRVRFGIATFDGISSYDRDEQRSIEEFVFTESADRAGLWSYPAAQSESMIEIRPDGWPVGSYRYPGCPHPYFMNTGIRSRDAESGALIVDLEAGDADWSVDAIRNTVLAARPFGSTPIAAALDDVRALFQTDPLMRAERDDANRRRHVILITDGAPDNDYREHNCDCNDPDSGKDNCEGLLRPEETASQMHCPYPKPEEAARALRCGTSETCDSGVVDAVHVIGFAVTDNSVTRDKVDEIANAGGTTAGVFAEDADELRAALATIIEGIVD